jgi:hypothetical protein
MTQAALQTHKKDLMRETPNFAGPKFLYHLSGSDYRKEWGKTYEKPGAAARIMAIFPRYMSKVGPFKGLGFDNPTPKAEDFYIKNINTTVDQYHAHLEEVRAGKLVLPNCDLDDGEKTTAAEYTLADKTYASLPARITADKFAKTSSALRGNILAFYSNLSLPIETRQEPAAWQAVLSNHRESKAMTASPVATTDRSAAEQ